MGHVTLGAIIEANIVVPCLKLSNCNSFGDSFEPSNGLWWYEKDEKYQAALLLTWLNFNLCMDNNHKPSKVWDEFTYPFLKFNGATVEV